MTGFEIGLLVEVGIIAVVMLLGRLGPYVRRP